MMPMRARLERVGVEKVFFGETRRHCAPQETIARARCFFPIMGITRVANITGLDKIGIPVYIACRPQSRSLSVSQGKGYTHEAAQASAIMESIEAYHAESIRQPLMLCSYNELYTGGDIADIGQLPRYSASPFTLNERILWIKGTDLFSLREKWLPYELVHTDYRSPLPAGHGHFVASSNGLSSGNHHYESIVHGLCEVIERDALTLWSLKPAATQLQDRVDPNTIRDQRCADILNRFSAAGLDAAVWNITSDLGVPAFLCRILGCDETDVAGLRPAAGMGCHLSRDIALLRALTEAAQSRLTAISGARDDMRHEDFIKYQGTEEYYKWKRIICPMPESPKDYGGIKDIEKDTFDEDLQVLLSRLKGRGIREVVVVDLMKEEFGIPVTRVVVPGLESFLSHRKQIFGERAGRVLHGREAENA